MPNATPLPQGFDELITAVVNAAYDCGDFRGEGADYQEEYQPLIDKSRAAKDALRAAIAALAEDAKRACEWRYMDYPASGSDFESSCGNAWSFINGGLKENNMVYCNKCGGKIVFVPPSAGDEEDAIDSARGASATQAEGTNAVSDPARTPEAT